LPEGYKTKSRAIRCRLSYPEWYRISTQPFTGIPKGTRQQLVAPGYIDLSGRQSTASEGHYRDPKTGHYSGGGPFYTSRSQTNIGSRYVHLTQTEKIGPCWQTHYQGPLHIPIAAEEASKFLSKLRSKDTSGLEPYGADAIALSAPTNPVASVATGLSESVREGVPSIPGIQSWKKRTAICRAAASEFLNVEFGWLPLIGEITDVRDAARKHRDILEQYHRDAGKLVRRSFNFPKDEESSTTIWQEKARAQIGGASSNAINGGEPGTILRTAVSGSRKWFVGAFTYAPPAESDSFSRALGYGSDADKLFGISLTPDVIWELTPWSWAVDWVTNASSVIHNVSQMAQYGLVLRYGYIMEESYSDIIFSMVGSSGITDPDTQKQQPVPPPMRYNVTSKVRQPANPFGFGITWDGLSPTQIAIAAAVGITQL